MSKWEKVAWMEIGVTAFASLLVLGAYPWYGIQKACQLGTFTRSFGFSSPYLSGLRP